MGNFFRALSACWSGAKNRTWHFPVVLVITLACLAAVLPGEGQAAGTIASVSKAELPAHAATDLKAYLRDNPISPPDTTSPRATLESFILIMREASRLWRDVRTEFADSGEAFLNDEQELRLKLVDALIRKASAVFDLSDIPVTARDKAAIEISLQFHELLDRIYVPAWQDIPGEAAGGFLHSSARDELPKSWIIPSTDVALSKIEEGPRQGHFLISKGTVARIPSDYEIVKNFPPKVDLGEDLYNYYIYTPGGLVAPRWYRAIQRGPDWLQNQFRGQAYWQWLALGVLTVLPLALLLAWYKVNQTRAVPVSIVRRQLGTLTLPVTVIAMTLTYRYLCETQINITGGLMQAVSSVTTSLLWASVAWLTYRVLSLCYTWFAQNPALPKGSLDASLLHTAYKLFSLIVSVVIVGYGATQIGIPIYGVIAGLGVGGLAIALAAQPTLENLIGGVILYADRMVRVGEFCQFDDLSGTIETIGIRSTRIRALDRTVITIANSDLAKRKIVNFSRRDRFRLNHDIGLRYETSPDQMRHVLLNIRHYLDAHPLVLEESLRVRFKSLDDFALTVEINGYVTAADVAEFLGIQEEILFKVIEIVKSSGSDFAFPSSTTYFARDAGLDADLSNWAEEQTAGMRAGNNLPFPNERQTEESCNPFSDVWPPEGSVDRREAGAA